MNKRILFVCNSTASRLWRIMPQARYMLNQGYDVRVIDVKKLYKEDISGADLIVLQMMFEPNVFKDAKKKGTKIIFEMDDMIHWLPKDHYAKEKIDLKWKYNCYRAINMADALTVTNDYLKNTYQIARPWKKNIHVLPNYVDMEYWKRPSNPNQSDVVRIGYCGGKSHVKDLELIKEPLKEVLNKYKKVKFIQCGAGGFSTGNPVTEYNYGKDMFKDLPSSKREYSLGAVMDYWSEKLNSLQLDIGLAPVQNNKFSRAKTPIKWMEYGINGVPSICTKFLYKGVVRDRYNGFLAETEDDWYKYLCQLVESEALRKAMGKRAQYEIEKEHDMKDHLQKWEFVYKQLI